MNYAIVVRFLQRLGNIERITEGRFNGELFLGKNILKSPTFYVLHRDEGQIAFLAYFIDGADAGVGKNGSRTRLSQEATISIGIVSLDRQNRFKSNHSAKLEVYRPVDFPHAADGDQLFNPIMRNG